MRPTTPWDADELGRNRARDLLVALPLIVAGLGLATAILARGWPVRWLPPDTGRGDYAANLRMLKLMLLLEGGGLAALGGLVASRGAVLQRIAARDALEAHPAVALAALVAAHAAAFLLYFPPAQILSGEPVNTGLHLAHYYRAFAAHRMLDDGWRTVGYDPYFLCGYPAGIALDAETRGDALFAHAFAFLGLAYATKAYILLVEGLVPFVLWGAARLLGLRRGACFLAAGLGVLYWHWGRPFLGGLRWAGMHSFLLACQLALLGVACVVRFHDPDHRIRVACWAALAAAVVAAGFVQPAGLLLLAPALVAAPALGLSRLRRRDRAALLGLLGLGAAVHATWLAPAARHGALFGSGATVVPILSPWDVLRVLARPTSALAVAIVGLGIAGLFRGRSGDRLATWTVAATAAAWLAGGVFGAHLGPLSGVESVRALVPLVLLLALPAGAMLDDLRRRAGAGTPALVILVALSVACTLPAFASALDTRFYYVHRLSATLDPRFFELAAAIDAAAPSDGRLLFESTANARTTISSSIPLEALLPIHTRREVVGPPQPGVRYAVPALEFAAGSLGGRALTTWTESELAAYLERYDVGAIVAWSASARGFLAALGTLVEPVGTVHDFDIYRCNRTWGRVARGAARVRSDYDRIEISEASGDEVVVKMHWSDDLRATPAVTLERVAVPGDSLGFVGLRPGRARVLLGPGP